MPSTVHIAEDIPIVGSILGKSDGTSKVGDSTHRFFEINIAGSGVIDYATTLQFRKDGVNSLKIESDGRISSVTDPIYYQDVATKYYVDTHGGGGGSVDVDKILTNNAGEILVSTAGNVLMKI